jgi:hypothetical protein
MSKQRIDQNLIIDIVEELITDTPPTTKAGVFFRWLKKLIGIKKTLNIKIK